MTKNEAVEAIKELQHDSKALWHFLNDAIKRLKELKEKVDVLQHS